MEKTGSRSFWDKFWKDKDGRLTILQTPNPPLILWLVGMVAMNVLRHGKAHNFFDAVAYGGLFTWAYLEIRYGDSYFRRLLGVVAIIVILFNKV